jgi:hypothetical protein
MRLVSNRLARRSIFDLDQKSPVREYKPLPICDGNPVSLRLDGTIIVATVPSLAIEATIIVPPHCPSRHPLRYINARHPICIIKN